MARYISLHTLACLTRQGAEQLAERLTRAEPCITRRVLVSSLEGKMLVEFDAPDREALEKWLTAERIHYDWLLRVDYESKDGRMEPAA